MDRQSLPGKNHALRWEAKPAPRCYTFRNWRRSVLGLLLLLLGVYMEMIGLGMSGAWNKPALAWFPLPFILAGLWYSVGHLLLARREWEKVFYAADEKNLYVWRGFFRPRRETLRFAEVTGYRLRRHGDELATVEVFGSDDKTSLSFFCIEHPQRLTGLLDKAMVEHLPPTLALPPEGAGPPSKQG
ncbi:hypothetical protein [Geoalkalibacter sp.]|uniref:hypothetical protein n=1 Tax=Geoalkalibacter sp. TaxID=3041440 RepID=UPI00272EA243|nr:hypothetical protein [Geoalkalibacter sp.]